MWSSPMSISSTYFRLQFVSRGFNEDWHINICHPIPLYLKLHFKSGIQGSSSSYIILALSLICCLLIWPGKLASFILSMNFFAFKNLSCPIIDAQLYLYIYTQNHHCYKIYLISDYSIFSLTFLKCKYYLLKISLKVP